jgi:hypothetical protein
MKQSEINMTCNIHFNSAPFEAGLRDAAKSFLKFARMLRKSRMQSKRREHGNNHKT